MLIGNDQYTPLILTATGLIKTGQGSLGGFLVATGTPTITIYDGIGTGGTKILDSLVTVAATPYPFPANFQIGAYAVISGAGSVTFFYV